MAWDSFQPELAMQTAERNTFAESVISTRELDLVYRRPDPLRGARSSSASRDSTPRAPPHLARQPQSGRRRIPARCPRKALSERVRQTGYTRPWPGGRCVRCVQPHSRSERRTFLLVPWRLLLGGTERPTVPLAHRGGGLKSTGFTMSAALLMVCDRHRHSTSLRSSPTKPASPAS